MAVMVIIQFPHSRRDQSAPEKKMAIVAGDERRVTSAERSRLP